MRVPQLLGSLSTLKGLDALVDESTKHLDVVQVLHPIDVILGHLSVMGDGRPHI